MYLLHDPQQLNLYSYARGNPVRYNDPSGEYIETAFDLSMLAWSISDFEEDPSFWNGFAVLADGASLVVLIPAIVGGLRHGDDVYQMSRIAQDISKQSNWGNAGSLVKHTIDHASDFGLRPNDIAGYARAANSFISRAASGFKSGSKRYDSFVGNTGKGNGKTYYWDNKTKMIGVKNKNGTTATAFKPKDGKNYFNKQKNKFLKK
jgi:pyocin large subunit-like protein